ncbi:unnamed protein product, partial [Sphacelaria rigidula]
MKEQRRKSSTTHAVNLLRRGCELIDGGDPLSVARQPKLILVSLDAEKSILSQTDDHVKGSPTWATLSLVLDSRGRNGWRSPSKAGALSSSFSQMP